jgi:hypothetical protein
LPKGGVSNVHVPPAVAHMGNNSIILMANRHNRPHFLFVVIIVSSAGTLFILKTVPLRTIRWEMPVLLL